jgi:hypothetical protein
VKVEKWKSGRSGKVKVLKYLTLEVPRGWGRETGGGKPL